MSEANETLPILSSREIHDHTTGEEYESAVAILGAFSQFDFRPVRESDHLETLIDKLNVLVPELHKIVLCKGKSEYVSTEIDVEDSAVGPFFSLGNVPLEVVARSSKASRRYPFLCKDYFLEGSLQTAEGNNGHIRINYQKLPYREQTEICRFKPNRGLVYRVGLSSEYPMDGPDADNPLKISHYFCASDCRSEPRMIYTPFTENPEASEVEGYSDMFQEAIRDVLSVLPKTLAPVDPFWLQEAG